MSKPEQQASSVGKYHDLTFYVTKNWKLYVVELDRTYDDYESMTAAIERFEAAEEKLSRKKLDIAVVNADGARFVLSGVHAGNGYVITKPKSESRESFYPDVQWINEAIKQKNDLETLVRHIKSIIDNFKIDTYRGYGFSPGMHAAAIEKIESSAADAYKRAQKTTLAELLATTKPPEKLRF